MRNILEKAVRLNETVEVIYLAKDGRISKRKVKVLRVDADSVQVYCYLRRSKRKFLLDNLLAVVPIIHREQAVV